jgi:hypothetical protein
MADRLCAVHTSQWQRQAGKAFQPVRHLGQTCSQGDLRAGQKSGLEPKEALRIITRTDK